jgi:hypothetical protein
MQSPLHHPLSPLVAGLPIEITFPAPPAAPDSGPPMAPSSDAGRRVGHLNAAWEGVDRSPFDSPKVLVT